MSTWTLKYHPADGSAAVEKTLADWGIASCTVKRSDLNVGSMSFTIPVALAANNAVFQHKSRLLVKQDGVRYWEGRLVRPLATIEPGKETMSFTAYDYFYYFQQLPCHQTWKDHALANAEYARMLLFAKYDNTIVDDAIVGIVPRPVGTEITDLATTVLADLLAGGDGTPFAIGTIATGVQPQGQKFGNTNFMGALQTIAAYDLGRVTWWDYSPVGTVPLLQSQLAGSLPIVEVPFPLVRLKVAPNFEGPVPVVIITLKGQDGSLGIDMPSSFPTVAYPAAYTGTLLGSIQLAMDETDSFGLDEALALATAMWEQGQTIGWQGETMPIPMQDLDGRLTVGTRVSVTGGDAAWATMHAPVRTVTEDIINGRVTATFGQRNLLGASQLIELMSPHNRRIRSTAQEHKEKDTGNSQECSMGDKKEKDDPDFPPKGTAWTATWLWNAATGKFIENMVLAQALSGSPTIHDPAYARGWQDGSPLTAGKFATLKFIPD